MPLEPPTTSPIAKVRDHRLDFWRALCLIDMVVVHLIYNGVNFGPVQRLFGDYLRFAAGGFIFVAGLSIGVIFLPRLNRHGQAWPTRRAMWRRAGNLLLVHLAATISFVALDLLRGMRPPLDSVRPVIKNILLLREGGDLLLFYVAMVAISPLLLELLRRGLWWVLAAASVMLFLWGQNHPLAISTPLEHQDFPLILWQLIFTGGLLFGFALPAYTQLRTRTRAIAASSAVLAAVVLWALNFASDFGFTLPPMPIEFHKVPLSGGEALRYFSLVLSMIFITDLAWPRIGNSKLVAALLPIGRRSLAVYVVHVWVVGLLASFAWSVPTWGGWQIVLLLPSIVICWAVARGLDIWDVRADRWIQLATDRMEATRWSVVQRIAAWPRLPAGALLAVVLLITCHRLTRVPAEPDYTAVAPYAVGSAPADVADIAGLTSPSVDDAGDVPTTLDDSAGIVPA